MVRGGREQGNILQGKTPGRKPGTRDPSTPGQGSARQRASEAWGAYKNSRFRGPMPGSPRSEVWSRNLDFEKAPQMPVTLAKVKSHHSGSTTSQKYLQWDLKTYVGRKRQRREGW